MNGVDFWRAPLRKSPIKAGAACRLPGAFIPSQPWWLLDRRSDEVCQRAPQLVCQAFFLLWSPPLKSPPSVFAPHVLPDLLPLPALYQALQSPQRTTGSQGSLPLPTPSIFCFPIHHALQRVGSISWQDTRQLSWGHRLCPRMAFLSLGSFS